MTTLTAQKGFFEKLSLTLKMIKFQHSIFALPFALISAFYATQGQITFKEFTLIIFAMITARNVAMSFNRIADRKIDAINPRTKNRELVTGALSLNYSIGFCLINTVLFIGIASLFNKLTLLLSPFVLFILMGYSLTKRWTHFTQVFLGIALGLSPAGAWIALTGEITLFPILLGLGVLFWVAGFDLIYSTLDFDFDRSHNVKNLINLLGIQKGLRLAQAFHLFAWLFFFYSGYLNQLGPWYYIGVFLMGIFLILQHVKLDAKDPKKINLAFFTFNGYVAIVYLVFGLIDLYY